MRGCIAVVLAVALLLGGCNSIVNSTSMEVGEIAEENKIMPTDAVVDEIMKDMPDYVQVDKNTKYDEDGSLDAFFIPAAYSSEKDDIKSFDFLGVAGENTVIYSFATKMVSETAGREEVHCVAKYNYESGQYQEIHQNIGTATSDLKSFHAQGMTEHTALEGVAVYDRENYYYYDLEGNLKIQASLGAFINKQYKKNVSTQITNVVFAKPTRLYLLLTIQKGEVKEGNSGNIDWDKLEDDIEDKVQTRILAYDLIPIDKNIECIQIFSNYQEAVDQWMDMADGQEFSGEPDSAGDWAKAKADNPMEESTIYLRIGGILWPIYTWKGDISFLSEDDSDGKICDFNVDLNLVEEKKTIIDSKFQEEDLLIIDGHFYGISGKLINKKLEKEEISRTYTHVDEKGNTEEKTQTLKVPKYQILTIDNGFIEGYWLIPDKISNLYGATDVDILASEGKELFWLRYVGVLNFGVKRDVIYDGITENTIVSYDSREASPYSIIIGQKSVEMIYDGIHFLKPGHYQIPFDDLLYGFKEGNTESDKKLEEAAGSIGNLYSQRERITEWQVLNITDNDFIIATQKNGLLYYKGSSGEIRQIEKGAWLAVWEEPGDKVVVSGFTNLNSGYESKDLIYGKIKKYSKTDLINSNQ